MQPTDISLWMSSASADGTAESPTASGRVETGGISVIHNILDAIRTSGAGEAYPRRRKQFAPGRRWGSPGGWPAGVRWHRRDDNKAKETEIRRKGREYKIKE